MARRGRKPLPKATDHGNRVFAALPRCPGHLSAVARKEWRRLAPVLHEVGVLTLADRAALAAYCQSHARWVEAEEKLRDTPMLLKTPSGDVQQSPWLSVVNKQLEVMGRYMSELGLTPVARARLDMERATAAPQVTRITRLLVWTDGDGTRRERLMGHDQASDEDADSEAETITYELDPRL